MNNDNQSENFALNAMCKMLGYVIEKENFNNNKYYFAKQKHIQLLSMMKPVISKYSRIGFSYSINDETEMPLISGDLINKDYSYKAKSFFILYENKINSFKLIFEPYSDGDSIYYSLDIVRNGSDLIPIAKLTYEDNEPFKSWFLNYTCVSDVISSGFFNPEQVELLLADIYYRANMR